MTLPDPPRLSVVVASVEASRSIGRCLEALGGACAEITAEILVLDTGEDEAADTAERLAGRIPGLEVHRRLPGTLVPELWGEGIRMSRGRFLALTTGHCIVPSGWATALLEALQGGAAAAGAGLLPTDDAGRVDRAILYLRYAAFLDQTTGAVRQVDDLPGDNVAYPGDAVRTWVRERSGDGSFRELDYHRELRREGRALLAVPHATAGFGPSYPLASFADHRFRHGRQFGDQRVRTGESRWGLVARAPLVPLALFLRAAGRARAHGRLSDLLASTVPFVVLAKAWAWGEAVGALAGPGPSSGGSAP